MLAFAILRLLVPVASILIAAASYSAWHGRKSSLLEETPFDTYYSQVYFAHFKLHRFPVEISGLDASQHTFSAARLSAVPPFASCRTVVHRHKHFSNTL
jgi:hypothetical protein